MQKADRKPRANAGKIALVALLVVLAGVAGWFAERIVSGPAASLSGRDRQAIETVVHDYILAHPEILPEAMDNLQAKQGRAQLSGVRKEVETPFPGAVMGNPQGTVTLVEFTDFACGYCRRSVADVDALIARNPDLRIVIRELPILSPQSADAARMALAAAEQGKYTAFHKAMFAAGQPDPATIEAAARAAGLDMARARATAASPRVERELNDNVELARQLGFGGTPSWVVGDAMIAGAVGMDQLSQAIATARKR
ncbi:DsbA family protein [Novosphingobium album (ex Liu et al. 2023)]|uniref:DsbA family protein n=1 Tax=Novosphingobium album (ex Liu et al. 2023) TaxID=3031130 RepID=A0ABT5WVB1_9SPHN|nr:DsbA family protein [Novosphingobium album (ex Liu et al. 2023)]MDE8653818.1 DsbA family protein [Novosphingobium album (ex Liu et al. 2023)]